ncbi:polysaccharide deacetylase family protein [Teredinibacter turnerae]|uniref:polysaccharide deacetylase family protein n=1 Tax=Teredinibacter turnerae TaxID=2426 RepID=UPI0003795DE9|nr:polysaccharide deacetylase family protein [Teredinibacter turnerae]
MRAWLQQLDIWKKAGLCLAAAVALGWAQASSALVVLQYHHIADSTPPSTSTSPALFKQHLDYLAKHNYRVVSLAELQKLLDAAANGKSLPQKTVVITFDDGYKSIYDTAWPLLKKHHWPFAVFVNSEPHDEKKPLFMSWEQLKELHKSGVTIANHTDSHSHLIRRRANESPTAFNERRLKEITFAQGRIKKEIGSAPKFFAYPFGEYDSELLSLLKRGGYLAFGQQSGPVAADGNRQLIPRFPMGGSYGAMEQFGTKVASVPFVKLKTVVRDSKGRQLHEPELPADEGQPILELSSPILGHIGPIQCFASGQGAISVKGKGGRFSAQAEKPLPVGRSRYNCTAHAGGDRFYWFSQLFIRRTASGDWYQE